MTARVVGATAGRPLLARGLEATPDVLVAKATGLGMTAFVLAGSAISVLETFREGITGGVSHGSVAQLADDVQVHLDALREHVAKPLAAAEALAVETAAAEEHLENLRRQGPDGRAVGGFVSPHVHPAVCVACEQAGRR